MLTIYDIVMKHEIIKTMEPEIINTRQIFTKTILNKSDSARRSSSKKVLVQ